MRIKIEKEALMVGMQSIIGAISAKNILPILSNILLEVEKKELKLTATDLDIGMVITQQAQVVEEGAVTVPAKRILEIVKELPNKNIEIYTKKNNTVAIETEGIAFKILSTPKEEFPKLPTITDKEQIILKQQDFKKMLNMTSFAMSHDETRYVLNGTCFITTGEYIRMVATDGRRLAIITQTNNTNLKEPKKIIIPTKTIQEITRSLKDVGDIKIVFSQNQTMFIIDTLCIISRLIEGEFPNYEQAIPQPLDTKLKVKTAGLLGAIKRASLLTTPESQAIKLQLAKNKLTISKVTPEIGEAREDLAAEYGGEEFVIGFNPTYLIDVLKNIDDEYLYIELAGPEKPAVIRADTYVYIVLPMQTT